MSGNSHRFRDLEKDKEKQSITCSLQLILSYPVVPLGRWQFRYFLPLYHLSSTEVTSAASFSTSRSSNTPVSAQELDQQVRRGEQRLFQGAELPQLQSTGGGHRTHLNVPWTMEGSKSLPPSCHLCFQHHTLFCSCTSSCEQKHRLTQPA